MPYKNGGGNHLQYYDEFDGQYDDQTKAKINEEDKKALTMVHYFGLPYNELVFHWPLYNIHDNEYCDIFVKYARKCIKEYEMEINKAIYLLTFQKENDKSAFLNSLGYSINNPEKLKGDIYCYTDIFSLTFSRYTKNCLRCIAKTNLNGKIVTSVWELKHNFIIRFITLIPGGDKKWK